jgi:hypothetical protein
MENSEFIIGSFLPTLKKQQNETGKSLSIEDFIKSIKNLPDFWMEQWHGIRVDYPSQNQDSRLFNLIRKEYRDKAKWLQVDYPSQNQDSRLFNLIRKEYRDKAKWLQYEMLNHSEIRFELNHTDTYQYKLFAQRTLSFKQLANAICSFKGSWAQEQKIDPLLWTLYIEGQLCEISLRTSGYISERASLIGAGKSDQYTWGLAHYEWLEDVGKLRFDNNDGDSAIGALVKHAAWIAKFDTEFRHTCYADYLKTQKRYHRRLKNSKFNVVYLDSDGNIRQLSRGRDTRTKKNKRSFG